MEGSRLACRGAGHPFSCLGMGQRGLLPAFQPEPSRGRTQHQRSGAQGLPCHPLLFSIPPCSGLTTAPTLGSHAFQPLLIKKQSILSLPLPKTPRTAKIFSGIIGRGIK